MMNAPVLVSATPTDDHPKVRGTARLLVHAMPGFDGARATASTLLFVPDGPAPEGGWPVVAWAHGTTTPGHKACAPSLWPDLDGGLTASGFDLDYAALIDALVAQGFAAVAPDLEGLGAAASGPHPYFSGASAARSLIWGVRAAREADAALSDRYAVFGHSDGGRGVLYVEAHAGEAPELRLLGTAASAPLTSVPGIVAEKAALAARSSGKTAADARTQEEFNVALLTVGLMVQDATFGPETVMGPDLAAVLPAFRERCSVEAIGVIAAAMEGKGPVFAGHHADWAKVPAMAAFIAANDPADKGSAIPRLPTLIVQGGKDESVSADLNERFWRSLRAAGAPVEFTAYPHADHFSITAASREEVIAFLKQLFAASSDRSEPPVPS